MKLEHKLFVLLAALVALAAGLVNLQNFRQATRGVERKLRLEQRDKLIALAKVSQEALVSGNDLALVDYAKIVRPLNEYALWAAVVNADGVIVAHTDPAEIGKTLSPSPALRAPSPGLRPEEGQVLQAPVSAEGKTIGWVRMAVDERKLSAAAESAVRTAQRHAWQAFSWTLAIGLPLSFLLAHLAVRPLRRLLKTAQAVAQGDREARAEVRGGDELGQLAAQVNSMAERLYGATGAGHEDTLKLAHDLKSPLAAIQSYLYLIEEEPESKEEVRRNIESVRASAQRLSQMVTDILEKEKVLEGKGETALTPLPLEENLRKVYLMQKIEAERKGLYFMEPGLPFGMPLVLAHQEHLLRVLDNLVSNAIKYTPKDGSVWMEVEVKGPEVWVMVNDTGLGMELEELLGLFQRFERGRSAEVQEKQGEGLGLFIAKELVELMGGKIWAVSRGRGQGSTFVFTLKAIFDEVPA